MGVALGPSIAGWRGLGILRGVPTDFGLTNQRRCRLREACPDGGAALNPVGTDYGLVVAQLCERSIFMTDIANHLHKLVLPLLLNIKNPADCPANKVPDGAVYIGTVNPHYGLPESKWRDPYSTKRDGTREGVVALYRRWLCDESHLMAALSELRGRDLVCWCAPKSCHCDVLIKLANRETAGTIFNHLKVAGPPP